MQSAASWYSFSRVQRAPMRGVFALLLSCRVSLQLARPAALNPSLRRDWERNKTDAWGLYPELAEGQSSV